jgi:hypothetical protein
MHPSPPTEILLPPPPRPPPQPKPKHLVRRWLLIALGAFVGLALIGGLITALGGNKTASTSTLPKTTTSAPVKVTSKASTPVQARPAPTVTRTVTQAASPAPTVTQTVAAPPPAPTQPAAPPADTIIARFSGTGSGNTGTFTVPADGNWHLSWAYTNGSLFAGQAENFQVYEYSTDGTLVNVLVNALAIGTGQPTADPVYADPQAGSQVYFQVITDDATWELVPVTGTS